VRLGSLRRLVERLRLPSEAELLAETTRRYGQPGWNDVHLVSPGDRPIRVIKQLREVTSLGMVAAKDLVDRPPCLVAAARSDASAALIVERLEAAGATTRTVRRAPG
jgi:ribosomal protein L7/L12